MGEGHTLQDARIQFSSPKPCNSPRKRSGGKSRRPTEVAEDWEDLITLKSLTKIVAHAWQGGFAALFSEQVFSNYHSMLPNSHETNTEYVGFNLRGF